ncbi:MAG: ribonuclease HII [Gammaproteobacteria bacterium]|nr:ribonuclease HII [Gammaproteobacteria bacterium]MCZ6715730.1 ribonuclease HII [Gammaproteobacteria bacterium]MCZ6912570.1 ribonuclease HII [Pseudomonadota bacterium]
MSSSTLMVAGIDEAGRGPLAGPVVAAAVVLDPKRPIAGLRDSKKLSASRRTLLAVEIRRCALSYAVAWADPAEIDELNIMRATMLAMRRATLGLHIRPAHLQIDGNRCPDFAGTGLNCSSEALIGGDDLVPAISAASILAKVARDGFMARQHQIYPQYNFASHKGYPTAEHRQALKRHGACPLHRVSFEPVRSVTEAKKTDTDNAVASL